MSLFGRSIAVAGVLAFLATASSAQDANISFVMPDDFSAHSREALHDFIERLKNSGTPQIIANWSTFPARQTQHNYVMTFEKIKQDTPGPIFLIGWSVASANWLYGAAGEGFRPNWRTTDDPPIPDEDITDGMIALGAGWPTEHYYRGAVLSVPSRRNLRLPIVTMIVIGSGYDPRRDEQTAQNVAQAIYGTEEGRTLMRTMSLIPNGPTPPNDAYFDPERFGAVEVRIRPERDDDGDECDCDDDGVVQSCDPDGYVVGAMSQLERRGNFAIVPGFVGSNADDDDDDCDECEEQYILDIRQFAGSRHAQLIMERSRDSSERHDIERHFEDLRMTNLQGRPVFVMACDPD